jgi:hypothetical protein
MAPEIALNAIPSEDAGPVTVLDPMCGSGTVLSAANARGQHVLGVDIDPLAVLMSSVATSPIDDLAVKMATDEVLLQARVASGDIPWSDSETERFVDYWFAPKQKQQLIALVSAIEAIEDSNVRDVLKVAFSRIIITKTPQASLAADTSHSRPHRVATESDYDVLAGFAKSTKSLRRLLEQRSLKGTATVTRGDSRRLDGIADSSVDLIVTSPPYLNALDYMRGHKMALVWFGWSISTLRTLRGTSIGAERAPDGASSAHALELVDYIKGHAASPDLLPTRTLERFAGDMCGFASAARRVIRDGGRAVLVVGNSTLRGNYIQNDAIAQQALSAAGFREIERYEREIPANHRYMPINTLHQSSVGKRMRTEVVLTMEAA